MFLKEFRDLRKKPDRLQGLPDVLNYAALVLPGVLLLKDGALLAGFEYGGPDLNSASSEELAALAYQVNSALARLGDGWMLNVDLTRRESVGYPSDGAFPDPITAVIDRERQLHYSSVRAHFDTHFTLTLTFKPAPDLHRRAARLFFSSQESTTDWKRLLDSFERSIVEYQDALSARLQLQRLDDSSLLSQLNACITGRFIAIRPPEFSNYLDAVLANHRFVTGFKP